MKVNKVLKSFEGKVDGILESRARIGAAIVKTERDIQEKKQAIFAKSKEISEVDFEAILSGQPVPEANGSALLEMQSALTILEARLSGLIAKKAENRESLKQLSQELMEARQAWGKELLTEQLQKVTPAANAFSLALVQTIALSRAVVEFPPVGELWYGFQHSIGALEELARSSSVPFPETLVFTENPELLPEVQGTIKSLAEPDDLIKRVERELRGDRPAARTLEAVA